jgi:hypothetical protein
MGSADSCGIGLPDSWDYLHAHHIDVLHKELETIPETAKRKYEAYDQLEHKRFEQMK